MPEIPHNISLTAYNSIVSSSSSKIFGPSQKWTYRTVHMTARFASLFLHTKRAAFDLAVAALGPDFLGFPATGETFESKVVCRFTVVIGKSNKDSTPRLSFFAFKW